MPSLGIFTFKDGVVNRQLTEYLDKDNEQKTRIDNKQIWNYTFQDKILNGFNSVRLKLVRNEKRAVKSQKVRLN